MHYSKITAIAQHATPEVVLHSNILFQLLQWCLEIQRPSLEWETLPVSTSSNEHSRQACAIAGNRVIRHSQHLLTQQPLPLLRLSHRKEGRRDTLQKEICRNGVQLSHGNLKESELAPIQ